MFIRKNKISNLIRKERRKERAMCLRESQLKYNHEKSVIIKSHNSYLQEVKTQYCTELTQKDKEIRFLRNEINKSYELYQKIRNHEKNLDYLSNEIEDVVETMVTKVQESVQPFYRARAKVHAVKRRSDKKHEKVEALFRRVK